jgi:hypothetical protein
MKIRMLPISKLISATALLLASTSALAGGFGTVTHAPFETQVPMLGGAGLMVLAGLLGIVALRFMKDRKQSGGQFLFLALTVGALASAGSGFKIISDAHAVHTPEFSEASGGTVSIPSDGVNSFTNSTGFPQKITDISLVTGCTLNSIVEGNGGNGGGTFLGQCDDSPGTVLENTDYCAILVVCAINGGKGGEI